MIGFYLKKNFCDGWDNIFFLIVPNIIVTLYAALSFFILSVVFNIESSFALPLSCLAFIVLTALGMVLVMANSENAAAIANFQISRGLYRNPRLFFGRRSLGLCLVRDADFF